MSDFKVDLTNCDIEPIHIPGQVQSHGFMLVVNASGIIQFHSDNVAQFIPGIASVLLGQPLEYVESFLGPVYQPNFIGQLIATGQKRQGFERINPDLSGSRNWHFT